MGPQLAPFVAHSALCGPAHSQPALWVVPLRPHPGPTEWGPHMPHISCWSWGPEWAAHMGKIFYPQWAHTGPKFFYFLWASPQSIAHRKSSLGPEWANCNKPHMVTHTGAPEWVLFYLVSWHLCTWVHFSARREIRSNKFIKRCSFRNKLTLEAVKLWRILFLLTQIYRVSIYKSVIFAQLLEEYHVMASKQY